jgi:hypothetical protein
VLVSLRSPESQRSYRRSIEDFVAWYCSEPRLLISAVRTAWPATRPAHSFIKFRAYPLNVLPSGFRFLDGDHPADPLIAREWRNILPFCHCHRVRNENLSQIRRYTVYRARGDSFLGHGFHSTSSGNQFGKPRMLSELGRRENLIWTIGGKIRTRLIAAA